VQFGSSQDGCTKTKKVAVERAKFILFVCLAVSVATAGSFVRILNENYEQGPRQDHVQQFTLYQGDTILIATRVLQGKDISDLVFADADGNTLFSRHAYSGGDETLAIPTTGFYSLTIRNTGMLQKKTYSVLVERYNANPKVLAKSAAYRTRTVCDTTWKHLTRVDTLSVERVDTTATMLIDKTVHLGAVMTSGSASDFTAIDVPSTDYVRGYEPTVVFYAANVESNRALADMAGSLVLKAAAAAAGPVGIAGLLLGGVDLSRIEKGNDFGWELKYASTNALGQTQEGTQSPYSRVRSTREIVRYDVAHTRAWSIQLDNSYSKVTTKDVVLQVYLIRYSPVFRTAEHPDSTAQVETHKVPILPEE
jgi:hypothetical protein